MPVDIDRMAASVRFDVAAGEAAVSAHVEMRLEGHDGFPVFDLRQRIDSASFDGEELPPDALAYCDMGAGHDARMRAVDVACTAGSRHHLDLRYRLGTPDAAGALPVGWSPSGDSVAWDLWMSDLEPGRYLEMWFPANLCHDAMAIEVDVEVAGTDRPHLLLANGAVAERGRGSRWAVRYPDTFTSLSPLLVLAPKDAVEVRSAGVSAAGRPMNVTVAGLRGPTDDLAPVVADLASWLSYFTARYGRWAHGDEFLAVVWEAPRGMEYDGATTASSPALEHEVFHSWFGRGVKPARGCDGWIDEAMATWATSSRRDGGGRCGVEELGLDEPPVLLCPAHPWSRHTPREAYAAGGRLMAGLAHMAGGAGALRSALAGWHQAYAGAAATTEDLASHLQSWCGQDLGPWWDRYVYGSDGRTPGY